MAKLSSLYTLIDSREIRQKIAMKVSNISKIPGELILKGLNERANGLVANQWSFSGMSSRLTSSTLSFGSKPRHERFVAAKMVLTTPPKMTKTSPSLKDLIDEPKDQPFTRTSAKRKLNTKKVIKG